MNPETIDRLIEQLGPVAEKLGEGAAHVYALAVRQAYLNAVTDLVWAAFLAAFVFVAYRVCRHAVAETRKDSLSGWAPGGIVVAILGVVATIAIPFAITSAIHGFANPQFAAFEILMGSLPS